MSDKKLVHWLNIAIAIVVLVTAIAAVFIGAACSWRHLEWADNPAPDAGTGTITGTLVLPADTFMFTSPFTVTITQSNEKEGDK
jgi:disulfide bond formation protein DsbB